MSLKAGIVGLPNVGKSTLFNAITNNKIVVANYPFATIEPNVGIVIVPDQRMDFLVDLYKPKSIVPTSYEFIDIAGLVKGASNGEGLGNKFLSHIREVDAIVHVVRCFDNPEIIHVSGKTDPISDIEVINTELILSDLEVIQNRLDKIEKKAQATKDKSSLQEVALLKKIKDALEKNIPVRRINLDEDEINMLSGFNLITQKKVIYAANVDEETMTVGDNEYTKLVKEYAENEDSGVVIICAKMEEELAQFSKEEKIEYLASYGLNTSGLDRLIYETYDLLGLATFFTAGADEVRAWTFKKGMLAPKCAGIIHSDFEKGFIKAEIMSYDDLKTFGTELKVKEAGRLRLEGKEYLMQDGDICYFRFNV